MLDFNSLHYEQKVNYIVQNVQAFIAVFGIIGNVLSICVFLRKRFRQFSYSFYSIIMACFDIVVLLHSIRHWAALVLEADIDLVAPFLCSVGEYQPYVCITVSLWLLALISLDRLLTIQYTNRFKLFKKRWFQATLAACLLIYSLLLHIQLPLYYKLTAVNGTGLECAIPIEVNTVHSWIYLSNIFLVAIVINNVLSGKMIWYLLSTRKAFLANWNQSQQNKHSANKDRKFAISSISLNICCMICKLPFSIGLLVTYYLVLNEDQTQLLFTIFVTIYTIDNGFTFVINMLVNSIFYEEFFTMIGFPNPNRRTSNKPNSKNKSTK